MPCQIGRTHSQESACPSINYGVDTIRRLLKIICLLCIIGLFCRIQSFLQGSFAKETYNFEEPTNRSHHAKQLPNTLLSNTLLPNTLFQNLPCTFGCQCLHIHLTLPQPIAFGVSFLESHISIDNPIFQVSFAIFRCKETIEIENGDRDGMTLQMQLYIKLEALGWL